MSISEKELIENNKKLIEHLKSIGVLKSKKVEAALLKAQRHKFVPKPMLNNAYEDFPLSIGCNQTISQPATTVLMTEALDVKKGQKVLEVGAGSGWQAAILASLVGKKGIVYTVEIIKDLVFLAMKNLKKLGFKNIKVILSDGSIGLEEHAPYDRIIVTAASPDIPRRLIEQLKVGGKLILPVGSSYMQKMLIIEKTKTGIKRKTLKGIFVFVPLKGEEGFK